MSKIVIIGGSGHVGSYLIPSLIELGHQVINVSRGNAQPYRPHWTWGKVEHITIDRKKEEEKGNFGHFIAELQPDIVVDMISFNLESTKQLVNALKGKVFHYLFCSSIWVYGSYICKPSVESDPVTPIDEYGQGKAESESWLMRESKASGFPATCFRPGHIVGEGWIPTTPLGNSCVDVFTKIAKGDKIYLPNQGIETLHHVHANDVAQWVIKAIENRNATIGEIFNVVSEQAITLKGYAEQVYLWFNQAPNISFLPYDEWLKWLATQFDNQYVENSIGHIVRSSVHSIDKSKKLIGYSPSYSSLAAIYESIQSLVKDKVIEY